MLIGTRGIVFNYIKYSDSSIICRIYTEALGIKSYIVYTPKTKKTAFRMAFFQPLTLLDLVVYNKENKSLNRIKEVSCTESLQSIPFNVYKSSMALFISEVLYKAVKEEESNPVLFSYVHHFIKNLDAAECHYTDYHLVFLMHLTQYLGFLPKEKPAGTFSFFDMVEGKFCHVKPLHSSYIESPLSDYFHRLLKADFNVNESLKLNGRLRHALLEKLVQYYSIHLEGMGTIQSMAVLKEIFA